MSSNATAVITNAAARDICRKSGLSGEIDIARFKSELLRLDSLERTAQQAADEAEKAINDIAFWEKAIVVSKVTQVCADWFIEFASEMPGAPDWVAPAYDGTKNIVAILNDDFTAQKLLKETGQIIVKVIGKYAEQTKRDKLANGLDIAQKLVKAAESLHELHETFTAKPDDGGVRGARASALKQVARIRGEIAALRAVANACQTETISLGLP
jgi:hypothetical protein